MSKDLDVRNRVSELVFIRAGELIDNEGNWRVHPTVQAEALQDSVAQVGITDVLKVYRSQRYGGLTLIDGHLRKDVFPDVEWPAIILDVTDEEADLILASGDAIAALAEASAEKLIELRKRIAPQGQGLRNVLDGLYQRAGAALERVEQLKRSPVLESPRSQAAQVLREKLSQPVIVPPAAVASAPYGDKEILEELLETQDIPTRPDFSDLVERFQEPERGKAKGNENWFYIEYYDDPGRWDELCALLADYMVGGSKHEVDPDLFYQAMFAFLSGTMQG